MRDKTLHVKKDGRVFQMLDAFTGDPMEFSKARHNYTERDLDELGIGGILTFSPMYGNRNPVYSTLVRLQ